MKTISSINGKKSAECIFPSEDMSIEDAVPVVTRRSPSQERAVHSTVLLRTPQRQRAQVLGC